MPLLTFAAALALAADAPPIGRWHEIGRDEEQTDSLDLASIEGTGTRRTAWTRAQYAAPREGAIVTDMYQNEYDCAARTFSLIAWRRLDASGRETDRGVIPAAARRTGPIRPGTIGADEIALICGEVPEGPPPIIA